MPDVSAVLQQACDITRSICTHCRSGKAVAQPGKLIRWQRLACETMQDQVQQTAHSETYRTHEYHTEVLASLQFTLRLCGCHACLHDLYSFPDRQRYCQLLENLQDALC